MSVNLLRCQRMRVIRTFVMKKATSYEKVVITQDPLGLVSLIEYHYIVKRKVSEQELHIFGLNRLVIMLWTHVGSLGLNVE